MQEIEIYDAFKSVGVKEDHAKKATRNININENIASKVDKVDSGINLVRADIAALNNKIDALLNNKIDVFQAKTDAAFKKVNAEIGKVDSKVDHKVDSIRWMIGIVVPLCSILVTVTLAILNHLK